MNYPKERLSFNPMQPDIICIAQLQFTFPQYRTDTDCSHHYSPETKQSQKFWKKSYYKSQQINKLQNITFTVPGAAVLNIDYTMYNGSWRARVRHTRSHCKYVMTITMHKLELTTLFYINW